MKKNVLVILIVIGVIGVVAYLLKDRLKALLGERAKVGGIPGEIEEERRVPLPGENWFGLKRWVRPEITMEGDESAAKFLQEEIAPVLKPLYPQRYIVITKGLLAYLLKGEAALPPEMGEFGYKPRPTNGPYSWALPQA